MDKQSAYVKLFEIKKKNRVNITEQLKKLAVGDSIPYDVICFINRYLPIEYLETYNHIYKNRRKNPLYKNLVNENLSSVDQAIALSSLLTQTLIHSKNLNKKGMKESAREHLSVMNTDEVVSALKGYMNGNEKHLNEVFLMVRDVFKNLYGEVQNE